MVPTSMQRGRENTCPICDPAQSCQCSIYSILLLYPHSCNWISWSEWKMIQASSLTVWRSYIDTSSQAATIQILHGYLNCARHADLGYEGIWLGRQLLLLNSMILYHRIYGPPVVYCGAPDNKVGNWQAKDNERLRLLLRVCPGHSFHCTIT